MLARYPTKNTSTQNMAKPIFVIKIITLVSFYVIEDNSYSYILAPSVSDSMSRNVSKT